MSGQTRDLTLERINRLSQTVADLMESQTSQARHITRALEAVSNTLGRVEDRLHGLEGKVQGLSNEIHGLASEQVLLANRVEDAFSRTFRTNLRLDEIEDTRGG